MLRLAYVWLICFSALAHAGVGVVRFANEGEIVFDGTRVVKAAGVRGCGGVIVLEEGLWKVGDQILMVSAGKETDLGKIYTRGENSAASPIHPQGSRTLEVEAASDQQWRLAGEQAWHQGSAKVVACDGVHRLEWRDGEQVASKLLVMSNNTLLEAKLPVRKKVEVPIAPGGAGMWITGPARDSGPQLSDVAVLRDTNGKVLAWQRLGGAAFVPPGAKIREDIPLVALDNNSEVATPEDLMPKVPPSGASKAFNGWEIVSINNRDYVTAESIRNFYNPVYGFTTFRIQGTHFWLGSSKLILKAQIGSQEMLINNIKLILSFPVAEYNGKVLFSRLDLCKLIDPVLYPSHIQNAEFFDTVVVDVGHGGHDDGAHGAHGLEKDFALQMATSLRAALVKRGFKVVMTRTTDVFVSDAERVKMANQTAKSIFISIQFNSSGNTTMTGIETLALTPQSASDNSTGAFNADGLIGNQHDSGNIALATAVHASVISRFKFVDLGIKRSQLTVLTGCKRPGIVFKGGFISNDTECQLVASDTYRQQVSSAIGDAVLNYRKALESAMEKGR